MPAAAIELPNLLAPQQEGGVEEAGAGSAGGLVENGDEVPGQSASFAEAALLRQEREADHWEGLPAEPAHLGEYREFREQEGPQLEHFLELLDEIPLLDPEVWPQLPPYARLEVLQQMVSAVNEGYGLGLTKGFPMVQAKDFREEEKAVLQRNIEEGRDSLSMISAEQEGVYIRVNEFLILDDQFILAVAGVLHEARHASQFIFIKQLDDPVMAARLSPYERARAERLAMNDREYITPSLDAEGASKGIDPRQHFRAYQEQAMESDARNFEYWAAEVLYGISPDDYEAMVIQRAMEYTEMLKWELRAEDVLAQD